MGLFCHISPTKLKNFKEEKMNNHFAISVNLALFLRDSKRDGFEERNTGSETALLLCNIFNPAINRPPISRLFHSSSSRHHNSLSSRYFNHLNRSLSSRGDGSVTRRSAMSGHCPRSRYSLKPDMRRQSLPGESFGRRSSIVYEESIPVIVR